MIVDVCFIHAATQPRPNTSYDLEPHFIRVRVIATCLRSCSFQRTFGITPNFKNPMKEIVEKVMCWNRMLCHPKAAKEFNGNVIGSG